MKVKEKISVGTVISGVGEAARRKAFRQGLPVAVSENGRTILIYKDGRRTVYTGQIIRKIDGKA